MDIRAQVSGGTVATYNFDLTGAADAQNVVQNGYLLTFNWRSFTQSSPAYRVNTIIVSTTNTVGDPPPAQTLTFHVYGTNSPACTNPSPTTVSTWLPSTPITTPDKVMSDEESISSQYYQVGLQTGEVRVAHALPAYNPGVPPLSLVYAPPSADSRPIFIDRFTIDPTRATSPPRVSAKLTLNGVAGSEIYYDSSLLNPGDILHMALQASTAQMNTITATGRYSYLIDVTAHYTPTVTTQHSGQVTILNNSTGAFTAGWSLDVLQRIWPINAGADGAILEVAGGRSLWFAPNGSGGFNRPAGDFSTLEKIGSNYRRTLKDGTQINFDANGKQTSIVDRNTNTLTFAYNGSNGRLETMTDTNGRVTNFGYSSSSDTIIRTITDPASRVTTLTYNATATRLTSITDPDPDTAGSGEPAPVTSFGYEGSSARLRTFTDPRNHSTTFDYDSADRVQQVNRPDTSVQQLTPMQKRGLAGSGQGTSYNNPAPAMLSVEAEALYKDPRNYEWLVRTDWLGFGRTMQGVTPLAHMSVTHRNANGLDWMTADPLARRTRFEFDTNGNATRTILPDENTEQFTYNTYSRVTSYTNPRGNTYSLTYDSPRQVNLIQVVKPDVTQDGGDVPFCEQQGDVCVACVYTHTAHGYVETKTDVYGREILFTYDAWDRLTDVTYPDDDSDPNNNPKVVMQYNAAGNLTQRTDELGKVTLYDPDNLGRVRKVTLPDEDADPNNNPTIVMTYDAAGNRTSLTDPRSNLTNFTYDTMNRLETEEDPFHNFTSYFYDLGGNLEYVMDRNARERYFLVDESGRTTLEQWWVGETLQRTLTFVYDAANQLTQAHDPDSKYQMTYHARGWLTQSDNDGTPSIPRVVLNYGYDANGNRTSLTDNLSGSVLRAFDARDRLTETTLSLSGVTKARVQTGYDEHDRLISHKRNEAAATPRIDTSFDYDTRDRLKEILHTGTAVGQLAQLTYTHDASSRLLTCAGPEGTRNFTHDPVGQLKTVTGVNPETYTYDSNGNRTMAQYTTGTANRLTADPVWFNYVYDNEGNVTARTRRSDNYKQEFTWDFRNRLTQVVLKDTGNVVRLDVSFTYDVVDRRIGKRVDPDGVGSQPAVQSWFVYDGANTYADFNSAGTLTYRYLFGPAMDELYARYDPAAGETTWYLGDHLGSVRQRVKTDGTVLSSHTYDSYGNILTGAGTGDRFKYTAREWDAEIGLQYNRARYYDSSSGRWFGEDPIGFSANDPNLYRYVANNPDVLSDPTGLWSWSGCAGGALVGGGGGALIGGFAGAGAGALIGCIGGGFLAEPAVNVVYGEPPPGKQHPWQKTFVAGCIIGIPAGVIGGYAGPPLWAWWTGEAALAAEAKAAEELAKIEAEYFTKLLTEWFKHHPK